MGIFQNVLIVCVEGPISKEDTLLACLLERYANTGLVYDNQHNHDKLSGCQHHGSLARVDAKLVVLF